MTSFHTPKPQMSRELLQHYDPWVLLIAGILGHLNLTLFYRAQQRWIQRTLSLMANQGMFDRLQGAIDGKSMQSLMESLLQNPLWRWIGLAQSIPLITGSVVWFVLRP
jgi:hypothetical protein